MKQQHLNQMLLDAFPCIALLLRPQTREIIAMNQAAAAVGCALGQTCFATWPKSEQPCPWCLAPKLWESGREQHLEVEGLDVVWDAHWIPVADDLYLHYAFDITKNKQADAERENLQLQLVQAQKMESVGRLAGGIAHDYNNMLSVIMGCAEMALSRVSPGDELHTDLTEIYAAASHSADITHQLLAFARKQTISPKVIDLNALVESILTMLRQLLGEAIDLHWHPGKQVWHVEMDPVQVEQILANLCSNAKDAISGVGKVTIETENAIFNEDYCRSHAGFVPGGYVLLAVSDNGYGMDAEVLNNVFEPFFSTKGLVEGKGLGLATVYGIVKQNNGFINIATELGKGTTFQIYMPRYASLPIQKEKANGELFPKRHLATVLLVEDEPAILRMGESMLRRLGYRVLAAATPIQAMDLAKTNREDIDLLISDVVMPGMNGLELAKKLSEACLGMKTLFMSGYAADVIADYGVLEKD